MPTISLRVELQRKNDHTLHYIIHKKQDLLKRAIRVIDVCVIKRKELKYEREV